MRWWFLIGVGAMIEKTKIEPLGNPEPNSEVEFTPYVLMRSENAAIGRIITAGSEIEQVVSIALFKIINVEPLDGYTLFGASSIGQRIGKLRTVLQYKDELAREREQFEEISPDLTEVIQLRNMFAHGVLMGAQGPALCYTITNNITSASEDTAIMVMRRFRLLEFTPRADQAELVLDRLRLIFGVSPLHERYVLRVAEAKAKGRKAAS